MVLTKTPICNFGEKARNFNLLSIFTPNKVIKTRMPLSMTPNQTPSAKI